MAFIPLPVRMRAELKRPMGRLVPDASVTRAELLRGLPAAAAGAEPVVVTVGDATTARVSGLGIAPVLEIVDGVEGRVRRGAAAPAGAGTAAAALRRRPERLAICENRAGGICTGCADLVRDLLEPPLRPSRIEVDGEEDLLVVPACIHAPDGAAVMYGQPGEGIVVVTAGPDARHRAKSVLERMSAGHDETVAE